MRRPSPARGTGPKRAAAPALANVVQARRLGIDTRQEAVILLPQDSPVSRAEGFSAHSRVQLTRGDRAIIATLYEVTTDLLAPGEAGLSDSAWHALGLKEGDEIGISHPRPLGSLSLLRSKVFGRPLDAEAFHAIVTDIVAGRYSDVHLASFVTALAARPLDRAEMVAMTGAMVTAGDRLAWPGRPVVDKHSVGGLPGNRTTPIVVAICAAAGLVMPKTSSRAITSPSGTADTMETLAPIDLDIPAMRRVVEREGGCVIWGGAVRLSPADDVMIRIERALDLDSEGQLVASVLSKKVAAGATHVVLDVPMGPTAKVRTQAAAESLARALTEVAATFGLTAQAVITDGTQPVGRGIGPALEARDVLDVLRNVPTAPADLSDRSITLAAALIELCGAAAPGTGRAQAGAILADGRAWAKFQRICEAQGGMRTPPEAAHRHPVAAARAGRVGAIDNRRLSNVAKLAGAPDAKAAGVEMEVRIGDEVGRGQPLYIVHAETPGELAYALDYVAAAGEIVRIEG